MSKRPQNSPPPGPPGQPGAARRAGAGGAVQAPGSVAGRRDRHAGHGQDGFRRHTRARPLAPAARSPGGNHRTAEHPAPASPPLRSTRPSPAAAGPPARGHPGARRPPRPPPPPRRARPLPPPRPRMRAGREHPGAHAAAREARPGPARGASPAPAGPGSAARCWPLILCVQAALSLRLQQHGLRRRGAVPVRRPPGDRAPAARRGAAGQLRLLLSRRPGSLPGARRGRRQHRRAGGRAGGQPRSRCWSPPGCCTR